MKQKQINKLFRQATVADAPMRPLLVVLEDLNVVGMKRNRKLALAISDVGLAEFKRQMAYKIAWQGETLLLADRWFPSTKLCSRCGNVKKDMDLSERIYVCENPACGLVIDRDLNAALNLAMLAKLCFCENLLDDLLEHSIWLRPHHYIAIGKDERRHAAQPVFVRQFDIGGYFGVVCWVCQHIVEVLSTEADLLRDLFQHGFLINRPGLLPVGLHDSFMESVSFPLRFGILISNERGTAIDAKWAGVHFQAVLFARPLFQHWA
ncbi:MAG TPA: zinc ribbon domain-containing protein [Ktedonobacteraceae bacterium]